MATHRTRLWAALLALAPAALAAQDPHRAADTEDPPPVERVAFQPPPFALPSFALKDALDKDRDGKLSAEEIRAAGASLRGLDQDKDGKLSAEEIGWPPRPRFRDGGRPMGGFPFGPRASRSFAERLMARDADHDGRVTKGELPRSMQFLVGRADADRDGGISEKEAQDFAKKAELDASRPE